MFNDSILEQLETSKVLWTLVSVDMTSSPPKITELSNRLPARRTLVNFLLDECENFAPISSRICDLLYARQKYLQKQEQKQLEQNKEKKEQQEQEKKEQLKQLPLKSLLSDLLKTGWSALLFLENCCHPANYFVIPLEEKPLRDWWFKHYSDNNVDPMLIKELKEKVNLLTLRLAREREEFENLKKLWEREEEEKAKNTIMSLIGRFPRLRNYVKEFFEDSDDESSSSEESSSSDDSSSEDEDDDDSSSSSEESSDEDDDDSSSEESTAAAKKMKAAVKKMKAAEKKMKAAEKAASYLKYFKSNTYLT